MPMIKKSFKHRNQITIIGAGITGLTTAIVLQDAGFSVRIITKDLPHHTTSVKAAAVWFPFHVHPLKKVIQWSIISYHKYKQLATIANTGVTIQDFTSLLIDDSIPDWISAMPKGTTRKIRPNELPENYKYGYISSVPIIDAPVHLNYLMHRFEDNGGIIDIQTVDDLAALAKEQIVINCTGLAARELVDDTLLYPIRGQLVHIKKQNNIASISDDDGPNALSYIIHRSNVTVLGGTLEPVEEAVTQPEAIEAIVKRCQQIEPNLKEVDILKIDAGLRPARPSVRLERAGNIIHNYGHGGGGYTVSWGCAQEVLKLLNQ